MSKGKSGLFSGTLGAISKESEKSLSITRNEPTSTVWEHIVATQEMYADTKIPKSFTIDVPCTDRTPAGKIWTHGNATEHMYEAITSIKDNPKLKESNPNLYTQFIMYDYYKSLEKAIVQGINYKKTIKVGNWEFAFAPAREGKEYPVVKHALFAGLKK